MKFKGKIQNKISKRLCVMSEISDILWRSVKKNRVDSQTEIHPIFSFRIEADFFSAIRKK